jgi:hypothetical protein
MAKYNRKVLSRARIEPLTGPGAARFWPGSTRAKTGAGGACAGCAPPSGACYIGFVQVVLRKIGRGSRAVIGRLVRAPRKGSVVVIEFSDGMHEYVTTPVKRVLRLAGREVFYIETVNSRYRLEVRGREVALDGAVGEGK